MSASPSSSSFWRDLFILLHRYAGIFIAPFIFIAAFTGLLYVLTPQLEHWVYQDALSSEGHSKAQSLTQQIQAAQSVMPATAQITAVRPAPSTDDTTRVIYSDPQHNISSHAVFVDPHTLNITGELEVYGTSGTLPLRIFLDHLHRDLLLREWGRVYSELAASWMGILALSGLYHWFKRRKHYQKKTQHKKLVSLKWHSWLGLILLPLLLFFSITGLTWSNWAGSNILNMRQWLGWQTPSLMTSLSGQHAAHSDPHHEHHAQQNIQMHSILTAQDFEDALKLARMAGIAANKIQIRPPTKADQAWVVEEMGRSWPTQMDSVAIDLQNRKVIDHIYFEQFPLAAKLTRWGVDAHIGVLFGWPNQLILILFAAGLCIAILFAYRAWWQTFKLKRETLDFSRHGIALWKSGRTPQKLLMVFVLIITGISLPIFGLSLILALAWVFFRHIGAKNP